MKLLKEAIKQCADFSNLSGNMFDGAIMKTNALSKSFYEPYLPDPYNLYAFKGLAIVFDGPEDYLRRINDPLEKIDANCILLMRGTRTGKHLGGAEVVNIQPFLIESKKA